MGERTKLGSSPPSRPLKDLLTPFWDIFEAGGVAGAAEVEAVGALWEANRRDEPCKGYGEGQFHEGDVMSLDIVGIAFMYNDPRWHNSDH